MSNFSDYAFYHAVRESKDDDIFSDGSEDFTEEELEIIQDLAKSWDIYFKLNEEKYNESN